jgi:outer membrane protein assembly factor BamB
MKLIARWLRALADGITRVGATGRPSAADPCRAALIDRYGSARRTSPTRGTQRMAFAASLLSMTLLFVGAVEAGDWPRWRGPDFDGVSRETGWSASWRAGGPTVSWRSSVGTGFSSFAVADGRLYTMGNRDDTDTVYCLDAATGKLNWKHAYACPLDDKLFEGGPTATPTVAGGRVYTLSRRGDLFAFDAASGEVKWSVNLHDATGVRMPGWGFASSPLVHGGLVVVNAGEAGTAVEQDTGKVAWASGDADAGYTSPVPYQRDGKWCAAFASGKYYLGVQIATGKVLWQYRWLTRYSVNAADPIIHGDRVFISSGYNKGDALLKLTGGGEPELVWKNKHLRNKLNGSVLIDGYLYGFDGEEDADASLNCVVLDTGELRWSEKGKGFGSVTVAAGKLIVLTAKGELIVAPASPDGFKPVARAKVLDGKCWTVPVLANGRIYCRNAAGDIVCLDVKAGASP